MVARAVVDRGELVINDFDGLERDTIALLRLGLLHTGRGQQLLLGDDG